MCGAPDYILSKMPDRMIRASQIDVVYRGRLFMQEEIYSDYLIGLVGLSLAKIWYFLLSIQYIVNTRVLYIGLQIGFTIINGPV